MLFSSVEINGTQKCFTLTGSTLIDLTIQGDIVYRGKNMNIIYGTVRPNMNLAYLNCITDTENQNSEEKEVRKLFEYC